MHNRLSTAINGTFAYSLTFLFLLHFFAGCASQQTTTTQVASSVVVLLPQAEQEKAIVSEQEQDYFTALEYWQNARDSVEDKISFITTKMEKRAQSLAEEGTILFDAGESEQALQKFFTSLRYDPQNDTALEYLTKKYTPQEFITYEIEENDSFSTIAKKVYGSIQEKFFVLHYSRIPSEEKLKTGKIIKLPEVESFILRKVAKENKEIYTARKLFKEEKFAELVPLSERLLEKNPGDQEASYLLNSSLIGLSKQLRDEEKYAEAIAALERVNPNFKNVKPDIAELKAEQEEKAKAIKTPSDAELLKRGKQLFAQKKYTEALQVYKEVDPLFEGVDRAINEVLAVMQKEADEYYKKGVKYFINDDLPAAIEEWQKTLAIDPDHKKAQDYLAKAQQLLEKVEAIE